MLKRLAKRLPSLLCFLLFLATAPPIHAQLFRYLDPGQGQSSRRVISIEKDYKGYMWFLTYEGVSQYNGKVYEFYPLKNQEKNIQQYPNRNKLQTDSKGHVWILGEHGNFFRYSPMRKKFELQLDFNKRTQGTKDLPLTMTMLDYNDNLWLCTKTKQYIYRPDSGDMFQLESSIHENITCIAQVKENQYFFATNYNVYPVTLQGKKLKVEKEPTLENFYIIRHLYYHPPTQQLLINTLSDGCYIYHTKQRTLKSIKNTMDININRVAILPDKQDEALVATDGNGVYHLNLRTLVMTPFLKADYESPNKMNGDIIKDMYIDETGHIWMAVFPSGITVYNRKYPEYEWLKHSGKSSNALVNNQVTYLLEDTDGDIWVATGNGISHYNIRTRRWTNVLDRQEEDPQEQSHVFTSLCEPTPGVILAGGYMSGMYRIEKNGMKVRHLALNNRHDPKIRSDKYIRSIYRDAEGYVWAGGFNNLRRLNIFTGETEHYNTEYPITVITARDRNHLWVGTTGGLYEFDKRRKKIEPVNLTANMGSINAILQEGEHTTYIGTNGNGMYIYNKQSRQLENYITTNSALISNNVYCILPGNDSDKLLISTENELACFKKREKVFLNWTGEQGLMPTKFNASAGVHTRNEVIAFGSSDGIFVARNPIKLPHLFHSKLIFNDLNIYYQRILPGEKGSPLIVPIDETREITLHHNQNTFAVDVSSINYDCPSRVLYSWKLGGFFNEWSIPNPTSLIRYTNISPGEYLLKVRSILLDDGRTLEERNIRITIEPPFSHTIWAMMIYAVILTLIAIAVMRFLWMRKESNISKEKIRFFINTAHDIRTPITLIKAPLSEISQREALSDQGRSELNMAIQSTEKLAELATKLIEFQKEEMYTSEVNVTLCELNGYVKDFTKQFEPYAQQKGIRLETEGMKEPFMAWIDRNKTDSILHNLVSNALKYTPAGGEVCVKVYGNQIHWFLRISDTGIGISTEDQKKMFKHLFRGDNAVNLQITGTGIGMLQTYQLVKRHYGDITVNSKENKGTTFQLRFPINDKRYKQNKKSSNDEQIYQYTDDTDFSRLKEEKLPKDCNRPASSDNRTSPIILIVEDHMDLRDFLRQTLSETYRIREAANGKEALDLITQEHPDLVLSDVLMPVMRGDDLCRTLKNDIQTSHIPVILLTALNNRESIIHGLEVKADSYLPKPFDVEILKASIASILANKELPRQRFAHMDYPNEELVKEVPGADLDREFILKVTETVKKNLSNDFNVDSLCSALNMSRSSFYNKIKALTNQAPSDFVRHIRLNEACILLRSRKYTVGEVSDILGYNDPKYFTELFKKHYGMTPSAYMKQKTS